MQRFLNLAVYYHSLAYQLDEFFKAFFQSSKVNVYNLHLNEGGCLIETKKKKRGCDSQEKITWEVYAVFSINMQSNFFALNRYMLDQ